MLSSHPTSVLMMFDQLTHVAPNVLALTDSTVIFVIMSDLCKGNAMVNVQIASGCLLLTQPLRD